MQMIKTRAAIARGPNQPLSVEEVDLMPPQKGEVWYASSQLACVTRMPIPCPAKILKAYSRRFLAMKAAGLLKPLGKA